jgi:hypothetical protein
MKYSLYGTVAGRQIFGPHDVEDATCPQPQGYSIAAVALKDGWTSDELGWLLNELYGALTDWTEFNANAGARSFLFWGNRAEEASNLCDTFAYAWSAGAEQQYDSVMSASNDAADVEGFVEAVFSGEISVGDAYSDNLQNIVFTAALSDDPVDEEARLIGKLSAAIKNAVRQHQFD